MRRLHLLSTARHPELYPFVTQLQSKLIDIYFDAYVSKQRTIYEFLSLFTKIFK